MSAKRVFEIDFSFSSSDEDDEEAPSVNTEPLPALHQKNNKIRCSSVPASSATIADDPFVMNDQNDFVEPQTFFIKKETIKSFLNRRYVYTLYQKNQPIYKSSEFSKKNSTLIQISHNTELIVSSSRTRFILRRRVQYVELLETLEFSAPRSNYTCGKRCHILFQSAPNLPHNLFSMADFNEEMLNGKFYIESPQNIAFGIQQSQTPVLMIHKIAKDTLEVWTSLKLDPLRVFGIGVSFFASRPLAKREARNIPTPAVVSDRFTAHNLAAITSKASNSGLIV